MCRTSGAHRPRALAISTRHQFDRGVEEYSFNKSGMCRSAHSGAEGAPRAAGSPGFRWRRAATRRAAAAGPRAWPGSPFHRLPVKADRGRRWRNSLIAAAPPAARPTWNSLTRRNPSREFARARYHAGPHAGAAPRCRTAKPWSFSAITPTGEQGSARAGNGIVADILFSADDPLASGRPLRHRFAPRLRTKSVLLLEMEEPRLRIDDSRNWAERTPVD